MINAQEKKTKALRQMRFKTKNDIEISTIFTYIKEAVENHYLGKEILPQRQLKTIVIPNEFQIILNKNPKLNISFKQLTASKLRECYDFISEAKRKATKISRLEKITPIILKVIGLNEKYKTT